MWESGDEHRIKGGDDEHSAPALLGWSDLARARYGECQGGVKDDETMMVARFGMVGQAGEASTRE